jgi:MYXO-CTERM domain-containing protein
VTRKARTRIARRLATGLALAALVIPATAQAKPAGPGPGSSSTQTASIMAHLHRNGQLASPAIVPPRGPVSNVKSIHLIGAPTQVATSSGFDWTDALIGSGVTAGLAALAMGGALAVRRQRRFGYR